MAIQHISTVICDYLIRSVTGQVSLIGIFKNINSPTIPIIKTSMGVYVELSGDVGDPFTLSIEGIGPDIVIIEGKIEYPPLFLNHQQSSQNIIGDISLNFENYGVFNVVLRSGKNIIHSTPYGVIQVLINDSDDKEVS